MGLGDMIKSIGEALIPIKKMDANTVIRAIKNPLKYKKMVLDDRQQIIVYLNGDDIEIIGGIAYSNVIFNPEIGKGWVINTKAKYKMEHKKAHICDPRIPFTLSIREGDIQAQYSITGKVRALLGLPLNWIQLQCDMLSMIAMAKWNESFMETRGSVMIMLMSGLAGIGIGIILTLVLFVIIGAFSK